MLGIRFLKVTSPWSKESIEKDVGVTSKSSTNKALYFAVTNKRNLIDIWMCALVVATSVLPLPAAFISVVAEIDLYYILGEKYLLPKIYERDMSLNFCGWVVRFSIIYIMLLELGRFISIFLVIIVAFTFVVQSILRKLQISNKKCHYLYTQFRLFFNILQSLMDYITGMLIGFMYVILIGLAWIVIKCYDDMPFLLYIVFLLTLIFALFNSGILLYFSGNVKENTELLVQQRKVFYFSVGTLKKSKLIQYKIWKAEKSTQFSCMGFFDIGRESFVVFWEYLVNDLVNALLLF